MVRLRPPQLVAVVALAVIVSRCSPPPTAPTAPQSSALPPQPLPAWAGSLTGVVLERTAHGPRAIPGARVVVVDLIDGPYGNYPWYELVTDANGGFALGILTNGRAVKITAFDKLGTGPLWNSTNLFQVRALHPVVVADTKVEVELVQRGASPPTPESPILSGVVFENTGEGLRPAADMAVLYSSNRHDGADVYTHTDGEGRYAFWDLPSGPGYLLPACTRATTLPPNYRVVTFPAEINGNTALDAVCP
jgi:hypothetical protein